MRVAQNSNHVLTGNTQINEGSGQIQEPKKRVLGS